MAASKLNFAAPPIQRGTGYQIGASPAQHAALDTGALSEPLQTIARNFVAARRRSGDALLDAARWLAEAKSLAQHGEWQTFLAATSTSEDVAEVLRNIHTKAMEDPAFAEAVASGWLNQSVAGLLARQSTPPEIIGQALGLPDRPTKALVGSLIQAAQNPSRTDFADADDAPRTPPPSFANAQAQIAAAEAAKISAEPQPRATVLPPPQIGRDTLIASVARATATNIAALLDDASAWQPGVAEHRRLLDEAARLATLLPADEQRAMFARIDDERGTAFALETRSAVAPSPSPLVNADRALARSSGALRGMAGELRVWRENSEAIHATSPAARAEFTAAVKELLTSALQLHNALTHDKD